MVHLVCKYGTYESITYLVKNEALPVVAFVATNFSQHTFAISHTRAKKKKKTFFLF